MPNPLTGVPDRPVPPLGLASLLIPPADAFMCLMLSRPVTGSLRRTWVTPATLWLCIAVAALDGVAAGWLAASGHSGPAGAWLVGLGILLAGTGCVAIVGASQRLSTAHGVDDGDAAGRP